MQACRDSKGRRRNGGGSPLNFALAFRLQDRLDHFFHEQGDAVRAFDNVLTDVRRDELVADNVVDYRLDVALREPVDSDSSHIGPSNPGRLELRTERHD